MQSNPREIKQGIMKTMNRAEERCESIKYILTIRQEWIKYHILKY